MAKEVYCTKAGYTDEKGVWHEGKYEVREDYDLVNHPQHYTSHPSGIECIAITRHMGFNLGNAVKYIWRADLKGDSIQDLHKAVWYLEDEITKRMAAS
jgi:hypothetical protein